MKPLPPAPPVLDIRKLAPARMNRVADLSSRLPDPGYLHWEKLRHLEPPEGLSSREWWLALKLKRRAAAIELGELLAVDGRPVTVSRHARIDAALARIDRLMAGNIGMPELARNAATRDQFIASSLMEEAIHSSLFEGAVSTREHAKELLRTQRPPATLDERMIANNYHAMTRLREMAEAPLTIAAVLELHRIITDGTLDDPAQAGQLQQPGEPRVQIVDHRVNRVVHQPPAAEQLADRMQRLVDFANGDDMEGDRFVHPVMRSILLHFQLAYDHPFADGNGRTARALFYWSMLRRGYWLAEFFSISRLLYRRRQPYELAYQQVESDEQDGTYFVLQQLEVLGQAMDELFAYVERKGAAQSLMRQRLAGRADLNTRQLSLLDHALRHPDAEFTHESLANSHRVSIMTARADLLGLVQRGWLRQHKRGKRHVFSPAPGLDALL